MNITSKQRAQLRKLANNIQPIFQLGKGSLNPIITQELDKALEARELIKISVLETCDMDAKEIIAILAERLHAAPVQCIGRKMVLYRESKDNKRIELVK